MARYLEMLAQKTPPEDVVDRLWKGSIDMHIHFAPDPGTVRRFDGFQTAVAARDAGMRGIVLKSHHIPSIQTAYAVQRAIPEVAVFGSISLDAPMGGLSDEGVECLEFNAKMGCKVVWFPLESAWAHNGTPGREGTGETILDESGKLKPIVYKFLDIIKEYNMVLCNGHLSYEESVALFEAASRQGIAKMVATHPFFETIWPGYTLEQTKRLADMGAYIEHCYRECQPLLGSHRPETYVDAIHEIGAERTILSTDYAQVTDTSPAEGMRSFIATMLQLGISEADITLMVKTNPAKLLDLD